MSAYRGASFRRWIARAAVAVGHALVVLIAVTGRQPKVELADHGWRAQSQVILLKSPRRAEERLERARARQRVYGTRGPDARALDSLAPEPAGLERFPPRVDWEREAERVGRTGSTLLLPKGRACDGTINPDSLLPKCTSPGRPFEWNPEPKTVEFDGLVPYVRIGKTCVVGLGFFACGFGKLPDANSHLFDEMNNPDRPKGSVPDAHE